MLKKRFFMQLKINKLLLDIRLSCEELQGFIKGMSYEEFLDDRKPQIENS